MSKHNQKDIIQKIKIAFNYKGSSKRFICPLPACSSSGYDIEINYCHSCGKSTNDISLLISGLSENHEDLFGEHEGATSRKRTGVMTKNQASSFMSKKNIPTSFWIKKTPEDIKEEKYNEQLIVDKYIAKYAGNNQYGFFKLPSKALPYFYKSFGVKNSTVTPATKIFYQNSKYTKSINFNGVTLGKGFTKGSVKSDIMDIVANPEELVGKEYSKGIFYVPSIGCPYKTIEKNITTQTYKKILVDSKEQANVVLGLCINSGKTTPIIEIKNSSTKYNPIPPEAYNQTFSKTRRISPDGSKYYNISSNNDYDDLIEIGSVTLEMNKDLPKEQQSLIKVGVTTPIDFVSSTPTPQKNHFFNPKSNTLHNSLELLKFKPNQTPNIQEEIKMIESLSKEQHESLDLQLQLAKEIKKTFPNEYFGVKGSANNLNILFDMGITSLDPSLDPLRNPTSFLDPKTNKNPDIDFELSTPQIEILTNKYDELIRGLTVTKDDLCYLHACKRFFTVNLPDQYIKYQSAEYIPVDSKKVEADGGTPIDLIKSKVMGELNSLNNDLGNPEVPDHYNIKIKNIKTDNLPHFNEKVLRQIEKLRIDPNKDLGIEELAQFCSLNRPIFYYSMLVLENSSEKYSFAYSGKLGEESLFPLDKKSKLFLSNNISQTDIEKINYQSKKVAGYNISFRRDNYLVSPPPWVKENDDNILNSTGGVITYQEQLMLILEKYTFLSPQEINDIIKKIAHPTKSTDLVTPEFFSFKKNTPPGIQNQVKFITNSQNAFFFKRGHALYLADTARKMAYLKESSNAINKPTQNNTNPIDNSIK